MTRLIDSILDGNYIQANELFEERMEQIAEKKLYEEKRRIASLNEGEYSAATQKALAGGKRLLTPQEREHGIGSDGSTRPATGIKKAAKKGASIGKTIGTRVAKGDIRGAARLTKRFAGAIVGMRKREAEKKDSGSELRKTFGVERPEDKTRPGIVRRNINTLMGRKPGYVPEPKKPEDQGGRLGKVIRKTAGVAKKAISGAVGGLPDMMPEETTPRKVKVKTISRNISKSRESIAVRRKGDKSKVKLRIPKDKYNPRIHNLV